MSLRRTVHITYEEGIILEDNGYELDHWMVGMVNLLDMARSCIGWEMELQTKNVRVGAVSEKRSCGAGDKE